MPWFRLAITIFLLAILAYPPATINPARAQQLTTEWSVGDGAGLEAGGNVSIVGLSATLVFGTTQTVDLTFTVGRIAGGSDLLPQGVRWFARSSSQNVLLDLSVVSGKFSVGDSFSVRAYLNLFDRPDENGTSAALDFEMAALIDGRTAQSVAGFTPEPSFTLLVLEKPVNLLERSNPVVLWVVSDGGGIEAGGHVAFSGLPGAMGFGRTYSVNATFLVEWFDWGDHIRPQRIEWYAKAGCVSGALGICASDSQNITLGSSIIDGTFAPGESFSLTTSWSLTERPAVNGTVAGLGLRTMSLVECVDPTARLCVPQGAVYPAQKFSLLRPESSVSSKLFARTIRVGIDVRPGTNVNQIVVKSGGVIPVSILSSAGFDANSVDPQSVGFGRTGTEAKTVRSTLADTNGDGLIDMLLFFRTQDTQFHAGDTMALLTGQTFRGLEILGSDSIRTF